MRKQGSITTGINFSKNVGHLASIEGATRCGSRLKAGTTWMSCCQQQPRQSVLAARRVGVFCPNHPHHIKRAQGSRVPAAPMVRVQQKSTRHALPGGTAGKAAYPVSEQKRKQGPFSLIPRRRTRRLPSLRKDGPGQVVHLPFPSKSPSPDHKIEHDGNDAITTSACFAIDQTSALYRSSSFRPRRRCRAGTG